jgi:amino acid permease
VSSTSDAGGTSSARKIAAIIFGVLAVLFIIAGVIYLAEPAKSLPSFLGHKAGSNGHHALRMAGSFIVGIVCAAMAWVSLAYKPKATATPANTPENTPAGTNS